MNHLIEHYGLMGLLPREIAQRPRCACGKARYATEREANRDARRMKAKGRGHSYKGLLRPYMCPERKGIWHVGHADE